MPLGLGKGNKGWKISLDSWEKSSSLKFSIKTHRQAGRPWTAQPRAPPPSGRSRVLPVASDSGSDLSTR